MNASNWFDGDSEIDNDIDYQSHPRYLGQRIIHPTKKYWDDKKQNKINELNQLDPIKHYEYELMLLNKHNGWFKDKITDPATNDKEKNELRQEIVNNDKRIQFCKSKINFLKKHPNLIKGKKYFDGKIYTESTNDFKKGDTILVGHFKNVKAVVKGFGKDNRNQPTVITDKGEYKVYNFRIKSLMKKESINLIEGAKYSPPLDIKILKQKYPHLLKDEAHVYRAKTGIELIHKEPSEKEQRRIWKNWNLMSDKMKKESDKKSIELYGVTNKEHHYSIMKESTTLNNIPSDVLFESEYWNKRRKKEVIEEPQVSNNDNTSTGLKMGAAGGLGLAAGATLGYLYGKHKERDQIEQEKQEELLNRLDREQELRQRNLELKEKELEYRRTHGLDNNRNMPIYPRTVR